MSSNPPSLDLIQRLVSDYGKESKPTGSADHMVLYLRPTETDKTEKVTLYILIHARAGRTESCVRWSVKGKIHQKDSKIH